MVVKGYRDLKVWQAGMRLSVDVYHITDRLPKAEQYGLISQMRRAAVSVPANISEGHQRQYDKEFCQFLFVASGSLAELETYLHLCGQLGYLARESIAPLLSQTSELGKMLNGLIARIRESAV